MDSAMDSAMEGDKESWVMAVHRPVFVADRYPLPARRRVAYTGGLQRIRRAFFTSWVATLATGILSAMQQCPDG